MFLKALYQALFTDLDPFGTCSYPNDDIPQANLAQRSPKRLDACHATNLRSVRRGWPVERRSHLEKKKEREADPYCSYGQVEELKYLEIT